jgi:hypothetical protein
METPVSMDGSANGYITPRSGRLAGKNAGKLSLERQCVQTLSGKGRDKDVKIYADLLQSLQALLAESVWRRQFCFSERAQQY